MTLPSSTGLCETRTGVTSVAHCRPDLSPALPKSILKPRATNKRRLANSSTRQRLVSIVKSRACRFPPLARALWHLKQLTEDRRIHFCETVNVTEFSRRLDGGCTMPGDDTIVTLGLGRAIAARTQRLAVQPPSDRLPIEERAWLTSPERVRVLRNAMGDKRFFGAWQRHRRVTRKIVRERQETNDLKSDIWYMPVSLAAAEERAARFSMEAQQHVAGPSQKFICETKPALPPKSALKRKHSISENSDPNKALASPLRSSSRHCHRCMEPINAHSEGMQCLCLIASPQSPSKKRRFE